MTDYPVITSITDATNTRVAIVVNKELASVPLTGLPVQPLDSDLTAIAALATTAYGRSLLTLADAAAGRTSFGLGSAATKELTDWVAYTPTFTGLGTVSGVAIRSRRVAGDLEIRGVVTAGTTTGVEAQMTLGFNGTNANVTSHATSIATLELAGSVVRSVAVAGAYYSLMEANKGYITFGLSSAGAAGLAKALGNTLFAAAQVISIRAMVPIAGW